MTRTKSVKSVIVSKDKSIQVLIADSLNQRWERLRDRLGYKNIQDVIKLAMEKMMSEDDARLGGEG